jgi:hypothetical protein
MRLIDHVGMSPATTIKLAGDPNRAVRGRRNLEQPSKALSSSPSESPTPTRGTDPNSCLSREALRQLMTQNNTSDPCTSRHN